LRHLWRCNPSTRAPLLFLDLDLFNHEVGFGPGVASRASCFPPLLNLNPKYK
jgi:hypothetical protein